MANRNKRKPVPAAVITELKTAVALCGYSNMTTVDPMTIREQYQWMENFFHGKGSLLEKGVGVYANLFDTRTVQVTNKNHDAKPY